MTVRMSMNKLTIVAVVAIGTTLQVASPSVDPSGLCRGARERRLSAQSASAGCDVRAFSEV
jgi:hypothetical protein